MIIAWSFVIVYLVYGYILSYLLYKELGIARFGMLKTKQKYFYLVVAPLVSPIATIIRKLV
jgi:hypothetical protein